MKTHVIYIYNNRDIQSYGRTVESSSITKLIDQSLAYIDIIRTKIDENTFNEFYVKYPSSRNIHYNLDIVDTHGVSHSFKFVIKGSPATLRKAIKHFEILGVNAF